MDSRTSRARCAAFAAAVFFVASFANVRVTQSAESPLPPDSRISPRLLSVIEGAGSDPGGVPVVVLTDAPMDDSRITQVLAAGGSVQRAFGKILGFSATMPASGLKQLAAASGVVSISYDGPVQALNDLNYATVGADLAARGASGFAGSLDGSGVTVAVLDSGVAAHPDLGSRLLAEVEIVGHEKGFADPYGHGTHVAGIIAGDGSASAGEGSFRRLNGIAPRARVVSVRVLDEKGSGRVSDVLAGIEWVLANKDAYGIRILNLSLGRPVEESVALDPLCRAVEKAWKSGIFVVSAAGNAGASGYGSIHSPGNDPAILTVGASNNYLTAARFDDILTSYASRGPTPMDQVVKPDLVAPGNRTLSLRAVGSTLDKAFPNLRVKQEVFSSDPAAAGDDSLYFQLSGSSMAAGVVSGMAALMIQADPSLTPDTLKARLMRSAEKRLSYDLFSQGAGFADLGAALSEAGVATAPALSPKAEWAPEGLVLQDTGALWGDPQRWSVEALFGPDPLRGTGGLWADDSLWIASASSEGSDLAGNSVVWGGGRKTAASGAAGSVASDSVVWGGGVNGTGLSGVEADSVVWGGGRKSSDSSTVSADSVVWGGGVNGSGSSSGSSTVIADSVVWGGGRKATMDDTLEGDNIPEMP